MKESQVRRILIAKPWKGSQRFDTTDSQFCNSVYWGRFFPTICAKLGNQKGENVLRQVPKLMSEENKSQGILDTGTKSEISESREESKPEADEIQRDFGVDSRHLLPPWPRCKLHKRVSCRCLGFWGHVGATEPRPTRTRRNLIISQEKKKASYINSRQNDRGRDSTVWYLCFRHMLGEKRSFAIPYWRLW